MNQTIFRKDAEKATFVAERVFAVAPDRVWEAHTKGERLGEWWAPKPWKAMTQSLDFREGGSWRYYMLGPDGTKSYCRIDYRSIDPGKSVSGDDYFCDENGERTTDMPNMAWKTEFLAEGDGTRLVSTIVFPSADDLEKILSLGMQEGYSMALEQLEGEVELGLSDLLAEEVVRAIGHPALLVAKASRGAKRRRGGMGTPAGVSAGPSSSRAR